MLFNPLYVEKVQHAKPNLTVLAEYKQREEEYLSRARDLEKITMMRDSSKKQYDELRKQRLEEFMQGFTLISQRLKEMYQVCFYIIISYEDIFMLTMYMYDIDYNPW